MNPLSGAPTAPTRDAPFEIEQSLFFRCVDLDAEAQAMVLAAAPAASAERVRRLLALNAEVEQGRLAEPVLGSAALPRTLGPYRLLEQLGEGGMGSVWLARQDHPVRRLVAIKLLRPGLETPELLARFHAERQALAVMTHPGIARLLDAGELGPGRPYLVMDYIEGLPLIAWCRRHGLDLRGRLALFVRLCQAVAHAHEKGVIHRDLKPGNVMVIDADGEPQPVVIDFGVAKALAGEARVGDTQTRLGSFMGTPDYMAPEQARGDSRLVDTRSDVWALGAILFELLCDSTPFRLAARGLSLDETLRALREESVPRPSARVRENALELRDHAQRLGLGGPANLARTLRGELDWIAQQALRREPGRRYPSASALAADVQRVLDDAPVEARPPSFLYLAGKLARRNAVLSVGLTMLLAALLAVAVLLSLHARDLERERERTLNEAARANEVTAFVTGLFAMADPRRGGGEDTTALELLGRAAQRVREQPAEDPRTQAELLNTLGDLYGSIGRYAEAEPLFAEEVALRARIGDALGLARAEAVLAIAWTRLGRGEQARALLEDTVARLHAVPGVDADTFAYVANALVDLRRAAGEPEALTLVEEMLQRLRADGLQDRLRYPCTLVQEGRMLRSAGRLEAAEASLREALSRLRSAAGDVHECIGGARSTLTLLLQDRGRYREAEALAAEQHAAYAERLGAEHPESLISLNNLGLLQQALGRAAEALQSFTVAVVGLRRHFGDAHPVVLQADMNRQSARIDAGDASAAEPQLASLRAASTQLPDGHVLRGALPLQQARARLAQGDPAEAARLATEAIAHFEVYPPPGVLVQLRARGVQAVALQRLQDPRAPSLHTGLLADAERLLGAEHPEVARLREDWTSAKVVPTD